MQITYVTVDLDDALYDFIFRRAWHNETCRWRKDEIKKIINANGRIRILGTSGGIVNDYRRDKDDRGVLAPSLKGRKYGSWIFERVDNGKEQCHGYFDNACQEKDYVENVIRD